MAGDILLLVDENGKIINTDSFLYCGNHVLFVYKHYRDQTLRVPMRILAKLTKKYKIHIYQYKQSNEQWAQRVADFFAWHHYDFRLVKLFITSFNDEETDKKLFEELPKLVPHLDQISESEYEKRWTTLLEIMQPGDTFFTGNPGRSLSKIITQIAGDPWSHTGIAYGGDQVQEMLTSGLIRRSILVYKDGTTRIGLYRFTNQHGFNAMIEYMDQTLQQNDFKYGYFMAAMAGLLNKTGRTDVNYSSPMDLVYSGLIRLIHNV